MNKIYKYKIEKDGGYVELPRTSNILRVDTQGDDTCIWVSFDKYEEHSTIRRKFWIVVTGEEYPPNWVYIGTFFKGEYVFHLHEEFEERG